MISTTEYKDTNMTLEEGEEVTLTLKIKTDKPYARWAYLHNYYDHFLDIFLFRRKNE